MKTTTNNNLSAYIVNSSVVNLAFFFRRVPANYGQEHRAYDLHDHLPNHQRQTLS